MFNIWLDTSLPLHAPAAACVHPTHTLIPAWTCQQPPLGQPGPAPIALLLVRLFNQIRAHTHTLDRMRRDRQTAHIYQTLPRKPLLGADTTTGEGSRPHSHPAPGTPRLCCSRLLCAPRSVAEQSLSSACRKLPEGFKWKHSPNQFIPSKNIFGLPFLMLLAQNCPWFSHPRRMMSLTAGTVKKHFCTLTFLKKNSKGKRNRFSGIFPFVPDYMINLAPALQPIITYCLLNFTSAMALPLFNSITGFYSKNFIFQGKNNYKWSPITSMVTSERNIRGEENTKLVFNEMHYSTPHVLLIRET